MKRIASIIGTLAAAAAPAALAQNYIEVPAPHTERGYVYVPVNPSNPVGPVNPDAVVSDPYWTGRREHGLNDWRGERYYDYRDYWERRDYGRFRDVECWNPRARHYEEVRRGEYQNDLDFSRCRSTRSFGWR